MFGQRPATTTSKDIPLQDLSLDAQLCALAARSGNRELQEFVAVISILSQKEKSGEAFGQAENAFLSELMRHMSSISLDSSATQGELIHYLVKIDGLCEQAKEVKRQEQHQSAINFYNQALTIITRAIKGLEDHTIEAHYRIALDPLDYCRQRQIEILAECANCKKFVDLDAAIVDCNQALTIPCMNFLLLALVHFERAHAYFVKNSSEDKLPAQILTEEHEMVRQIFSDYAFVVTQNSGRYHPENPMRNGKMMELKIKTWFYRSRTYALLAENNMRAGNEEAQIRYYQLALSDCNQALDTDAALFSANEPLRFLLLSQRATVYAKLGKYDLAQIDAQAVLQSDLSEELKKRMRELLQQYCHLAPRQPICVL